MKIRTKAWSIDTKDVFIAGADIKEIEKLTNEDEIYEAFDEYTWILIN